MKPQYSMLIALYLVVSSSGTENNVCPTFADYYTVKTNPKCWYDIAAEGSAVDIIMHYGYVVEEHKVVTSDGYILTLFRIPNYHPNKAAVSRKNPVLLKHGWLYSGAAFVGLGNQSLALTLADAGYDVWLGNCRGTEYSEGHVNLTVHDKKYWDYSVDHIALFDVRSELEYISKTTGQRGNIVYIGHSMGTMASFMYASTFPEEAKKTVKLFISLAPAGQLTYTKSIFFRAMQPFMNIVLRLVDEYDLTRIFSQGKLVKGIIQLVCLESPALLERCMRIANLFILGPQTQTDESTVPVFFNQVPAGISLGVLKQILSAIGNDLAQRDYGVSKNMQLYGSPYPPRYPISKIQVPFFLMYSADDWCTTKRDAVEFYDRLPRKAKIYGRHEIVTPNFNHNDFIYGKHARSVVYDPILRLLEKINGH